MTNGEKVIEELMKVFPGMQVITRFDLTTVSLVFSDDLWAAEYKAEDSHDRREDQKL